MTWIKTVPIAQADEKLRELIEKQRVLYPAEYEEPVAATLSDRADEMPGVMGSHSLIPEALYHAFGTFGVLMSPELPLSRREHEMIATVVSVANRCFY
jgi:hypothetical protein